MANYISFNDNASSDDDSLKMSNGGTDVLINVLALSGSQLAETDSEKRLIVYLSERDQITGRGVVGFCITDMPWDKNTFSGDKEFIIKVIDGARNRLGWEKLGYEPNEEIISRYLDNFERLINRMTMDDIRENALREWLLQAEANDPVYMGYPRCEKHNTFLTCYGCQVCNS